MLYSKYRHRPLRSAALPLALIAFASNLLLSSSTPTQARFPSQTTQQRVGASSATQNEKDVRVLEPGTPVERELAGGESHIYRITLSAGEYLHVTADQRGIGIVVVLRGPDGSQLTEMDALSGTLGEEELSWEAVGSGDYLLQVRAVANAAGPGRYEVRLRKAAAAGGRERARIAAERIFMEGMRAWREENGQERAIKKYEESLVKWREAGERKWEGLTLGYLGSTYARLSQYERAREHLEQALVISREIKDRRGEGAALDSIGGIYYNLSQYEKALDYTQQALVIWRETGNKAGEGRSRFNVGLLYELMSRYEEAQDHLEQALVIWREMKSRGGEAVALNNLGEVYNYLGQYGKALEYFEQSLAIRRELKSRGGEGQSLANLGITYSNLGQYDKAREYHEQALAISRETKNRRLEGVELINLGEVYGRSLGQLEKAREYLEQALAISREIKDKGAEGTTLNNLGDVYRSLRQYEKARGYLEESLAISREIKERGGEAETLHSLGELHHSSDERQKALGFYNQALSLRRTIGDRSGEAKTLAGVARLERDRGDLTASRVHIEAALNIVESLRTQIASQSLRATYFASVQDYYEFYTDLLMRLHKERPAENFAAAALQSSERARARSLLELLAEARADIRQGVDARLLERERILRQQLSAKAQRQTRLLGGEHTAQQATAIRQELEAVTTEVQQVEAQIRQRSPRYAALTQPQPLSLKEIQAEVLDADTLLLEYALGNERSYLWAVTPDSITSYELPKRTDVEAAARRFYELLTARNESSSPVAGETQAQKSARLTRDRERIAQAEAQLPQAAARLSRMVLAPVAAQLGTKRLLVISDGALQYVPFAALPEPDSSNDKDTAQRPLVVNHEIVSLPSASTLAVLRRELTGRVPAAGAVAVLADPVFSKDDMRVDDALSHRQKKDGESGDQNELTAALPSNDVVRALRDVGVMRNGLSLARLSSSRTEANRILAIAPAGAGMQRLDFAANRATATSGELAGYRIVHFATHGLLNSEHPELSGLVLSLVDTRGQSVDGFLRLHEVYNLKLPAELVVLSACQTGLGKEIKGEGLVGLTRGFMYAGAKGVAASLWKVEDAATRDLMEQFYRKMLIDKLRPAAALRQAQIEMWKNKRWSEPYNWAAFILQGEWK